MVDITREIYEVSCIKTIVDSAKIMWLNENMKEGLDHRNLTIVVKKNVPQNIENIGMK